jgi:hypothetical protein
MGDILWGRRLDDVVCASMDAGGLSVRDVNGRSLFSAHATDEGFAAAVARWLNPSKLVVAWDVEALRFRLRVAGACAYMPDAVDLKLESALAGFTCRTLAALCVAYGVAPAGDRAWRTVACAQALLADRRYLAARTWMNERALRQVQLCGDEAPAWVEGLPNHGRLVLAGSSYICRVAGVELGRASCAEQMRMLFSLGSEDPLPRELPCSVEVLGCGPKRRLVATVEGRARYRDAVEACLRIRVGDEIPVTPCETVPGNAAGMRLAVAKSPSGRQPETPLVGVRGIR